MIKAALAPGAFFLQGRNLPVPGPRVPRGSRASVNDPDYVDPATSELVKLSIFPRARQNPLPMWEMVNSLDSIRARGAAGPRASSCGARRWRALRERLRVYRDAVKREATGKELPLGARAAIMRDTFVADSEEEAVRIAGGPMMDSLNFSNWRGPSVYLDPGETLPAEQEAR